MKRAEVIKNYRKAKKKIILLDYDGTLVEFTSIPGQATPTGRILDILNKLADKQNSKVIIISGRGQPDIDKFLGDLSIKIIAEHGNLIRENGIWIKSLPDDGQWKNKIRSILDEAVLKCPGSFVEEKQYSLVWHYRNSPSEAGELHAKNLIQILEKTIPEYDLKLLPGNKIVEIMTLGNGKGRAVKTLVEQNDYDYILAIGDDKTDEEMFEYLLNVDNADTIKVGEGNTLAKHRLTSVNEVHTLLEELASVD